MDAVYSVLPRPFEAIGTNLKKGGVSKTARKRRARQAADRRDEFEESVVQTYEKITVSSPLEQSESNSQKEDNGQNEAVNNSKVNVPNELDNNFVELFETAQVQPTTQKGVNLPTNNLKLSAGVNKASIAQDGNTLQKSCSRLSTVYSPGVKSCPTGLTPNIEHLDVDA